MGGSQPQQEVNEPCIEKSEDPTPGTGAPTAPIGQRMTTSSKGGDQNAPSYATCATNACPGKRRAHVRKRLDLAHRENSTSSMIKPLSSRFVILLVWKTIFFRQLRLFFSVPIQACIAKDLISTTASSTFLRSSLSYSIFIVPFFPGLPCLFCFSVLWMASRRHILRTGWSFSNGLFWKLISCSFCDF